MLGKRIEQEGPLRARFLIFLHVNSSQTSLWNQINWDPLQISWLCPPLLLNQAGCLSSPQEPKSPNDSLGTLLPFQVLRSKFREGQSRFLVSIWWEGGGGKDRNPLLTNKDKSPMLWENLNQEAKLGWKLIKLDFFVWTRNIKQSLN